MSDNSITAETETATYLLYGIAHQSLTMSDGSASDCLVRLEFSLSSARSNEKVQTGRPRLLTASDNEKTAQSYGTTTCPLQLKIWSDGSALWDVQRESTVPDSSLYTTSNNRNTLRNPMYGGASKARRSPTEERQAKGETKKHRPSRSTKSHGRSAAEPIEFCVLRFRGEAGSASEREILSKLYDV